MERRRRQSGRWLVAGLSVLTLAASGCAGGHREAGDAPSSQGRSVGATPDPAETGLRATVEARGLGPIRASVTPLERAPDAWLAHELRLENTGDARVYLDDTRGSVFLGDPRQILAGVGEGCGYASSEPRAGVEPACHTDFRPVEIEAGASVTLPITLWKGLDGMAQFRGGEFALEHAVRYRTGSAFSAGEGDVAPATTGRAVIRYQPDI